MDPAQNSLSDNIDFSKVRIHVKTPKERFISFCGKWRNCFVLTFFVCLMISLIISLIVINGKISDEEPKKEKLPREIESIKSQVLTYASEVKDLNILNKNLDIEHQSLTSLKNVLTNSVKKYKDSVNSTNSLIEFNNKEIKEIQTQMEKLKKQNETLTPLYAEYMDEFLKLKNKFISLGGKEEDIPSGDDDKTIKGSKIVTTEAQIKTLENWLGKKIGEACFKTSVSGLQVDTFHKNCNKLGATITIIKTDDDEIIGGFTNLPFVGDGMTKKDPIAFLFNLSKNKKIPIKNQSSAITCDDSYFVVFGRDFRISDYGICYSGFPIDYGDSNSKEDDFSKSKKSIVIELETYTIKS